MEKDNIDATAKTTPKAHHKNFFGRLTKRSTKVEPHPVQVVCNEPQTSPMNFAKCQAASSSNHYVQNTVSQTLPALYNESLAVASTSANANGKSHGHRFLTLRKRNKNNKNNSNTVTILEAGSLSDGSEVVMRKSKSKQRSPNHNRFSHQFSLCCKTEKKPMTPPVTVRYNSIPDATNMLRRDNLSLNWSLGTENISMSLNSSELNLHTTQQSKPLTECLSAPESPVTSKIFTDDLDKSPSKLSTQTITGGPIRPIAVSACRSRLRLKLYPPDKQLPALNNSLQQQQQQPQLSSPTPIQSQPEVTEESIKRATTPQHMSSPNISTE